jgi:transcriptional regulator with XRE-family HTH domain
MTNKRELKKINAQAAEFGQFIKRIRINQGLTLAQVANAIGFTPQYVCDIEHGRRGANLRTKVLLMLADYLKIDPNIMFKNANVQEDIDDPRLKGVYKAVHNKGRAERIIRSLQEVEQCVDEIMMHSNEYSYTIGKRLKTLKSLVRELSMAIEL